jgi:hypothetical protein
MEVSGQFHDPDHFTSLETVAELIVSIWIFKFSKIWKTGVSPYIMTLYWFIIPVLFTDVSYCS